jgi:hypothetical protein
MKRTTKGTMKERIENIIAVVILWSAVIIGAIVGVYLKNERR